MSNNYALRALIDEIGAGVYEGRWKEFGRNVPIPLIPCQYHGILTKKDPHTGRYPAGNQYPDKSWEGARRVTNNGSVSLEYYSGFIVLKDSLGRCLIPATPNNIKRLDSMKEGKMQKYFMEKYRGDDGQLRTKRVRKDVVTPPLYTRLEQDSATTDIDAIVKAEVARALAAAGLSQDAALAVSKQAERDFEEAPVVPTPIPPPKGVVDVDVNGNEKAERQPGANAAGGEGDAPPPAKPPQPPRGRAPIPALAEAAARAAAAEV